MAKTKKQPDTADIISDLAKELLGKLCIESTVLVEPVTGEKPEDEISYRITIETLESGLLIGRHGDTLNSLQLLLGVMLFKRTGSWIHVLVDVGNYRKMREESVTAMADRIIAEVERTGQPVPLPFLSPLERRMVHMHLTDHPTVMSESEGEGRDRRLVIKPRASANA